MLVVHGSEGPPGAADPGPRALRTRAGRKRFPARRRRSHHDSRRAGSTRHRVAVRALRGGGGGVTVTLAAPMDPAFEPGARAQLRAARRPHGQRPARALAELGPRFVLPFAAAPLDFRLCSAWAPVVLEIGFGMATRRRRWPPRASRPRLRRRRGARGRRRRVAAAHRRGRARQPAHRAPRRGRGAAQMIRPPRWPAVPVVPRPWPKKRHHKRRLVQPVRGAGRVAWRRRLAALRHRLAAPCPADAGGARHARPNTAGYAPRRASAPAHEVRDSAACRLGHGCGTWSSAR